jgi:hypothetical protein
MHITISRCIRHHGRNGAGRLQATGLDPSGIPGWGFWRLSGKRGGSWTCLGGMRAGICAGSQRRCRERRGPRGIGAGSQGECRERCGPPGIGAGSQGEVQGETRATGGSARDPRGGAGRDAGHRGIGAGSQRRCRERRGPLGDRRGIPEGGVGRDAGHRGIGAGSQGCNNPGFKSSWPMAKVREPAEPGAEGS